jgi:hypothetical protein
MKTPPKTHTIELILLGMALAFIIAGVAIYGGNYLLKQSLASKLQTQLQLKTPMSVNQFISILNKTSGSAPLNVSYSGTLGIKYTTGVTTSVVNLNISSVFARYQNTTLMQFSYVVPSSGYYSTSYSNYTTTMIKNSTDTYYCTPELGEYSYYSSNPCINSTTFGIMENTSYNTSLGIFNILRFKGLKITINSMSDGTYKGAPCLLLNGTISGSLPMYPLQLAFDAADIYLYPIYSSSYSYNTTTAGVSGNYRMCISKSFLEPVSLNATVKISGFTQPTSVQLLMNETSEVNVTSSASVGTLPGGIANLSTLLPGYCYQASSYLTNYTSAFSGECSNPVLNTSGALKLNYLQYYNYYSQPSQNIVLLGLACSAYNPYIYTTTVYPVYPAGYNLYPQQPNVSMFTAVNISLSGGYSNTTLHFNCPLNGTKLGSKFYGYVWAYYKSGGVASVAPMFELYAYVTTRSRLGTNMNTGRVNPLPASFPNRTIISVPSINITSSGTGPDGAYETNDTLVWHGVVSPYASAELSIVNASTGSSITFTPDYQADEYGDVSGAFQTKSNILPGLTYLKLVDISTEESAQASFVKAK